MTSRAILFIIWLVCILATIMALLWQLSAILFSPARALHIAVGFDQLASSTWGNSEDETVSSRLGRVGPAWAETAVDWLFKQITGEVNHCKNNIEGKINAKTR